MSEYIELKNINLEELNNNMLKSSLRNYINVEFSRNLSKMNNEQLIKYIKKYDVDIEQLYNNYYINIQNYNELKNIESKKNIQTVEDKKIKYNNLINRFKNKLDYEKNINGDKTIKEQLYILKKINLITDKLNNLE